MNNKKSHEVQVMSELIDSIANYCGIKQVRKHFLLYVTRYLLSYSPYCVQIHHFDILSLLLLFFLYIIGAKEELLGPSWRTILFTNVLFQRCCLSVTHNHSWIILRSYNCPLYVEQLKTVLLFGQILPRLSVLYCWQFCIGVSRRAAFCHAHKGVT